MLLSPSTGLGTAFFHAAGNAPESDCASRIADLRQCDNRLTLGAGAIPHAIGALDAERKSSMAHLGIVPRLAQLRPIPYTTILIELMGQRAYARSSTERG